MVHYLTATTTGAASKTITILNMWTQNINHVGYEAHNHRGPQPKISDSKFTIVNKWIALSQTEFFLLSLFTIS